MYTQKKPIENSRIVRERDRQRFRELLAVLSLAIPVGLFLLLFTWQNLEVIRLGREASRLQSLQKELTEKNTRLQIELERRMALDSVERKAAAMGFRRSDTASVVMVRDGRVPSDGLRSVAGQVPAAGAR